MHEYSAVKEIFFFLFLYPYNFLLIFSMDPAMKQTGVDRAWSVVTDALDLHYITGGKLLLYF